MYLKSGANGTVCKCLKKENNEIVAVKLFDLNKSKGKGIENYIKEEVMQINKLKTFHYIFFRLKFKVVLTMTTL